MGTLQKTPLHAEHVALGAKLVDFSGWDMPVSYEGIIAEHRAVRQRLGLFDVSHMGEFRVTGTGAGAFLDRLVTNAVSTIEDGQALYSPMCRADGGTVDDLIVYRHAPHDFLLVVNAGNISKDFAWIGDQADASGVDLADESDTTALIAVQGPRAVELVAAHTPGEVTNLGYYHFLVTTVFGVEATVARLGYTGEDGFELMVAAADASKVWRALVTHGAELDVQPAGLGARDTLRFEVAFCLYGHELTDETTPLEAGIGWTVKLDKDDFIGLEALRAQKAGGVPRRLAALLMDGRRVPRQGAPVVSDGEVIGEVTSGMFAPTIDRPAALALVKRGTAAVGNTVAIDLRGTHCPAQVVKKPFYKRPA